MAGPLCPFLHALLNKGFIYFQPFISRGNVENLFFGGFKKVSFDNYVFSMFLLKLTKVYYMHIWIKFLFDCSLSLENEWLLSRDIPMKQVVILCMFQWEKNNLFHFLYVRIARMSQIWTMPVIFINTFSSSDQEKKIPRSGKAGVFQRMFWFRRNIIVVNLRMLWMKGNRERVG